ncbi:RNA-binding S4 domain-containing protein [Mycoplasma iguanae]|uniref:RNA-binding S4 domain-containing protein n=1 Tax=Mycoplasma iguanae TaxID=292461 RepID=A0ABY5R874_9MOLU|nr:RNA-binding S4 domain-containing protein [Mycoplasma iguanae]UVD81694.1 RNA-binding S4 domain-containing protein [Mycoplasma iguanae]
MDVIITGEFIKLAQLLKKMKIIDSGGQAKFFIENNEITVNSEIPTGKGMKVTVGSTVWINDDVYYIKN